MFMSAASGYWELVETGHAYPICLRELSEAYEIPPRPLRRPISSGQPNHAREMAFFADGLWFGQYISPPGYMPCCPTGPITAETAPKASKLRGDMTVDAKVTNTRRASLYMYDNAIVHGHCPTCRLLFII